MSEANDSASLNRMIGSIQGEIKHLSDQSKAQSEKLDKLLEDRGRVFEAARDIAEIKLRLLTAEGKIGVLEQNESALKGKFTALLWLGGILLPLLTSALVNWVTKG